MKVTIKYLNSNEGADFENIEEVYISHGMLELIPTNLDNPMVSIPLICIKYYFCVD